MKIKNPYIPLYVYSKVDLELDAYESQPTGFLLSEKHFHHFSTARPLTYMHKVTGCPFLFKGWWPLKHLFYYGFFIWEHGLSFMAFISGNLKKKNEGHFPRVSGLPAVFLNLFSNGFDVEIRESPLNHQLSFHIGDQIIDNFHWNLEVHFIFLCVHYSLMLLYLF